MKFRIGVDERPSFGATLLYGAQWLMICIPVVLTSTFIAPESEVVLFTQKLFAIMGATMIIQTLWGHRMPLVAGPATVLLMGILAAKNAGASTEAIYPSIALGGVAISILAVSGLLKKITPIFTPRIVVAIVLLIAFTMTKPILGMIFSDDKHIGTSFIFAIAGVCVMALANRLLKGVWKSMVVIMAMIIGALTYYSLTSFPTELTADSVEEGSLLLGDVKFDAGVIIAFCFCYIALLINEVGSVQSLGEFIEADNMGPRRSRGMLFTGLMNIVGGACGIPGPVDYSLSPGIVASTSCASRYTILPAAVAMIALAFCPTAVAFLLTIPEPVMGIVLLYLMATQVAAGLHLMHDTNAAPRFQEALILAIPIMFTVIFSFAPETVSKAIPELLRPIVGNSFVMGIIIILILEHLLLKEKK